MPLKIATVFVGGFVNDRQSPRLTPQQQKQILIFIN